MKFTVTQKDIQDIVTKFGRLLTAKVSIPILSGVLVQATQQGILFTASDGTTSMIVRLQNDATNGVTVEEEGSTVFPKELFDIAKKLKNSITFELSGTQILVEQNKSKFSFSSMLASDFPKVEPKTNSGKFVFKGSEFHDFVKQTAFAAATSDSRPVLQSVHMVFSNEETLFVSTDSHRLGKANKDGDTTIDEDTEIKLNVPAKTLEQAIKAFDLTSEVVVLPSDSSIALLNGNTILYSQLLEGNYPDTSRLIPNEFKYELLVNRKEMIDALELLQNLAKNGIVKLQASGLFIELLATGEGSKGTREIAFEKYTGTEDFNISFSAAYTLEALKAFEEVGSIKISFNDSMKPFVISEIEKTNKLQLILPVRSY